MLVGDVVLVEVVVVDVVDVVVVKRSNTDFHPPRPFGN